MRRDVEPWEVALIRDMDRERLIIAASKGTKGTGDKAGNVVYWTEGKDIRAALRSAAARRPRDSRRRPAK